MSEDEQYVIVERPGDRITEVVLNRPERRNALIGPLADQLGDALEALNEDESVTVIVLRGAGGAFCSGLDLKEFGRDPQPDWVAEFSGKWRRVHHALFDSPAIVVGALERAAVNGGAALALACDFIIAGEKAVFGQPEVNLGIIPCFGGTQRLSRHLGIGKAKEMIFTGDFVKADEAEEIGLVSRVVKQEALIDEAVDTMTKIISKAPLAIKYAKVAVNSSYDLDLKNGLELEKDLVGLCFATEDQSAGMAAFVEKRSAAFEGK